MSTPRKHTKFQTCDRHAWLKGEGRHRRAEFFVEGGPAGEAGCEGGECRLWPGTDIFEPSVCHGEMKLDWTEGTTMSDVQRTWTEVGAEVVGRIGTRADVEAEIGRLDWQEVPQDGSLTVGFLPGAGINEAIRQLGIPKVSRVAISSFEVPPPTGDGDGFYPGFYGVEGNYKNGRARVYLVDVGTELLPVASDFWPKGEEAAA